MYEDPLLVFLIWGIHFSYFNLLFLKYNKLVVNFWYEIAVTILKQTPCQRRVVSLTLCNWINIQGQNHLRWPCYSVCPHQPPWTSPSQSIIVSCLSTPHPHHQHLYMTFTCPRKIHENISQNKKDKLLFKTSLQQIRLLKRLPKFIYYVPKVFI